MTTFHTVLGFCGWDIPAAIVLAAVIAVFAVRHRKLKEREEELAQKVAELSGR
ncbi:MAG: hypothetical protein KBS68_04005 [Clostridiales bacterium]|nr:hypothetical protein [Candidatus Crickella merdequi]